PTSCGNMVRSQRRRRRRRGPSPGQRGRSRAMTVMNVPSYIIRGGQAGRERLRLLARVMWPTTRELFERAGVRPGMRCLDVGCGGGERSPHLEPPGGPRGVVGIDLDAVKIAAAREEAAAAGVPNVAFEVADVTAGELPRPGFDLVYVRFVLTHLRDPQRAVQRLCDLLVPGGQLVVED